MSWIGNIAKGAKKNILGKRNSPNQLVNEKYIRQPVMDGVSNTNTLYQDEDNNGIDDRLEPDYRPGQNITGIKKNPNPKEYKPFSFKGKFKNYNVSYNAKGEYVPTATYPLPPVSHQQKLMDRNRRMRNKDNKFL